MSAAEQPLLKRSAVAGALIVAAAMLVGFYSVVAGAVEKGAHRTEMASTALPAVSSRVATANLPRSTKARTPRISLASADN